MAISHELRLAMVGMTEDNGHPYSWSAIFNGYDPFHMRQQPFPVIAEYLSRQPMDSIPIPGAKVTHVWTDDPSDAVRIAAASLIPHVAERPEDVIGHVDAVLIPTDIGHEHVERARPFVEEGLPVFVDKPLTDNVEGLRQFVAWVDAGKPIMSCSCMRYCKEFLPYRLSTNNLGNLRFVTSTTAKSWKKYGIHALEAIYPIVGPGFLSARNTGGPGRDVVHFTHRRGIDVVVTAVDDMAGGFGLIQLCGTKESAQAAFRDNFFAFKSQLLAFVDFLRTGTRPFPWEETVELMKLVIAGIRSREEAGREVSLTAVV